MKTILLNIRFALIILAAGLLAACEERTPDLYSAPDGIYFNTRTRTNSLIDTASVTFVYYADEVKNYDVSVVVQSIGRQADYDRPVDIRVWSDNAVEGVDYELVTPAVLPAHTSSFNYVVRLKRTEVLKTELKSIYLELYSNDSFETFLEQYATGETDRPYAEMLKFRIDFSDYYSTQPLGWRPEYVGAFSERKLRLMWKLFDDVVDREAYNVAGGIPFNRWVYMQRQVNDYLAAQENILRGYVSGTVDVDALEDPDAVGDARVLLDFTPVVAN